MNNIELFSGTKSFSKVANKLNYNTLTIDNNINLSPDLCEDVLNLNIYKKKYDMLWASPPCTAFSVAAIGRNWNLDRTPKSDNAILGLKLLDKTISIIKDLEPHKWYIENPRGMMRKIIDNIFKKYNLINYIRHTVTYCQYGDTRMKPTDIWTNDFDWKPRPACKNGMPCHISAPRGSRTGTQGLKNATERGIIPEALFYEIFKCDKK